MKVLKSGNHSWKMNPQEQKAQNRDLGKVVQSCF